MLAIDLHVHESCMRVAVRVLHSCAFIIIVFTQDIQSMYTVSGDTPERPVIDSIIKVR